MFQAPLFHTFSGEQELTSSAEKALSELPGAHPAGMLEQSTRGIAGSLSTPSLTALYSGISYSLSSRVLSREPALGKINRLVAASSLLGLQPSPPQKATPRCR